MGLDQMHVTVSQHLYNASLIPGESGGWMFVGKEPSSVQLQLVETHHELEMHAAFIDKLANPLGIHLGIISCVGSLHNKLGKAVTQQ